MNRRNFFKTIGVTAVGITGLLSPMSLLSMSDISEEKKFIYFKLDADNIEIVEYFKIPVSKWDSFNRQLHNYKEQYKDESGFSEIKSFSKIDNIEPTFCFKDDNSLEGISYAKLNRQGKDITEI